MTPIRTLTITCAFVLLCPLWAPAASAQASQDPVSFSFDAGGLFQGDADLDEGDGGFSLSRWFLSAGVTYAWDRRNSIGLVAGGGATSYDFDDTIGFGDGPWEDIEDTRLSLVGRFGFGDKGSVIVIPSWRYNGEDDAKTSDGRTWGVLAAVSWRIREGLTLGPGIGVFDRLENGTRVFPILAIDWDISERWKLSTGRGLAASQGPGLQLSYKLSETWRLGLASRYENTEFRLDREGFNPGGIGRDRSLPMVLNASWQPNRYVGLSVFAGMEFNGSLKLKDADGETLEKSDYDTAPIFGATFDLRF